MFTCSNCHRKYKRKDAYIKHSFICQYATTYGPEKEDVSFTQLVDIVKIMHKKIITLESRINYLQTSTSSIAHPHTPQDVVQSFQMLTPPHPLTEWVQNETHITQDIIEELVLKKERVDEIYKLCFEEVIKNTMDENRPIKWHPSTPSLMYVYHKDDWIILDNNTIKTMLKIMHKKIMVKFLEWKKQKPNGTKYADEISACCEHLMNIKSTSDTSSFRTVILNLLSN